jgi:hypothetical protein
MTAGAASTTRARRGHPAAIPPPALPSLAGNACLIARHMLAKCSIEPQSLPRPSAPCGWGAVFGPPLTCSLQLPDDGDDRRTASGLHVRGGEGDDVVRRWGWKVDE